ncbi:MAG: apolipoprotein N-acyltransferase, partial [Bacteroidia bacterium]|nr:apolipoprotein N-acyltransferase [Bacteroidia bacterium]
MLLSLFSGLLLGLAWYWHLTIFIFFGFVPLLLIEDRIHSADFLKPGISLLGYAYVAFLTWNLIVTWWIVYASVGGACMAFVFNSLFMALVFVLYSTVKKRIGAFASPFLLIPFWLGWEHIHTLWDLTWSWMNIGNVFAFKHHWIQWYEITGVSGGTLWVLCVNIIVFKILRTTRSLKLFSKPVLKIALAIISPILLSYGVGIYREKDTESHGTRVLVVQPNVDPYNVKFYLDYKSQFVKMLNLVRPALTKQTEYLVLPETFITENINETSLSNDLTIRGFRDSLIHKFPNLKVIVGANTHAYYENVSEPSATARKDKKSGKYYDVYNSAIYITSEKTELYHKSKLVPGVERMPFPALLKPLEGLAIDMGGTMGSLGTQEERTVFRDSSTQTSIAPVICYESIYSDYNTGYIRNGADLIFVITNDGWWEDTPGYKQHLNYARLRAIENRREVARSANTGISCFIDRFGNISDQTDWWKEAVIQKDMYPTKQLTFFSRYGDLLSYCSVFCSLMLIITNIYF